MKKFKVTQKHLTIAVVSLGVFLILFGVLNGIFKFTADVDLVQKMSNYVAVAALVIFVWSRKLRKEEAEAEKEKEKAEEARLAEPPEKSGESDEPESGR